MADLILVKHSMPAIAPDAPAATWQLSAAGRARCLPLATALVAYRPEILVTSSEPKASETAAIVASRLGLDYTAIAGLHEHDRHGVPWLGEDQFAAQVGRFFAEPDQLVMGAETAHAAHARFARAVDGVVASAPGQTVAVVAHGTVISLYVAHATGVDPFSLWQQLGLPSFVVLALPDRTLLRVVAGVTE